MSPSSYILLLVLTFIVGALFDCAAFVLLYTRNLIVAAAEKFGQGIRDLNIRPRTLHLNPPTVNLKRSELLNVLRVVVGTFAMILLSYVVVDGEARVLFFAWSVIVGAFMPHVASSAVFQMVVGVLFFGVRIIISIALSVMYYPSLLIAISVVHIKEAAVKTVSVRKNRQKKTKRVKKYNIFSC